MRTRDKYFGSKPDAKRDIVWAGLCSRRFQPIRERKATNAKKQIIARKIIRHNFIFGDRGGIKLCASFCFMRIGPGITDQGFLLLY